MNNFMEVLILQAGGSGFDPGFLMMMGAMFLVFYFFIIRPQMKKNKEQVAFRESVKKGDKVVTSGGIHGKILEVRDAVMIIEVEGGGRLKVEKSSISMDMTKGKETPAK